MTALALPGLVAACGDDEESGGGGGSSRAGQSVFGQFGGSVEKARREVYFDSLLAAKGIKVVSTLADSGKFLAMAKRANRTAQWDTIDASGDTGINMASDGILVKPPERLPNDQIDDEYRDYFAGTYAFSVVQGYLAKTFRGREPETWADFWDVEQFPGKRGWPKFTVDGSLEAALLADGVAPEDIYPIDFDRAFAKLDELRDHLVFYDSYDQGLQALQEGAVAITETSNGRVFSLQESGVDATIVWNQAILFPWTSMPVIKNAPDPEATFELIKWMSDGKRQAEFAKRTRLGPTNSDALEFMDEQLRRELPNSPENRGLAFVVDQKIGAQNKQEYISRVTEWQTGA